MPIKKNLSQLIFGIFKLQKDNLIRKPLLYFQIVILTKGLKFYQTFGNKTYIIYSNISNVYKYLPQSP